MELTLNEYQKAAMTTCMRSCRNIPYMLFNLQGEVGELSSKIAKHIRRGELNFNCHTTNEGMNQASWNFEGDDHLTQAALDALIGELGDIAWQLAGVCSVLGIRLNDVCQQNLDKLASRKKRGVIEGEGVIDTGNGAATSEVRYQESSASRCGM